MSAPARILIVEDDRALRALLQEELDAAGHICTPAASCAEAQERLQQRAFDLVISDLRLPDGSGQNLLLQSRAPKTQQAAWLIITAFGSISDAVEALKAGADDFLTKPLQMEHLLITVERLLEHSRLRHEVGEMRQLAAERDFHGIVGSSSPMLTLQQQIRVIAASDGPALVCGESGTGKELVARALHQLSPRSSGPFIAINCAGIPAELIESELFGHEAGAFTDARRRRAGIFQQADGGTLLLDEIGEMPLPLQAKLLRVLQEGSVRPVGASSELEVNVRVIAATHRDVPEMVFQGSFREDLYYRLETFRLDIPPLRQRGDDLVLLAGHFLRQHARNAGRHLEGIAEDAWSALRRYPFPGNVRELSNALERAVAFSSGPLVRAADLPDRISRGDESTAKQAASTGAAAGTGSDALTHDLPTLEELQRRYIHAVLERSGGNKQRAAAILGITRSTLYRWLPERNGSGHGADGRSAPLPAGKPPSEH